jgi:hypothetical protein
MAGKETVRANAEKHTKAMRLEKRIIRRPLGSYGNRDEDDGDAGTEKQITR